MPFGEEAIMPIFVQLAMCLDHLHDKHVLHRDLKTKNIFLTQVRPRPRTPNSECVGLVGSHGRWKGRCLQTDPDATK